MIDIEKFICSLLADHPEGITVRNDIHKALKEQGLEYKDGKIVPIEDKTELKESEDERIRKWLYGYFRSLFATWIHPDITCEEILAWLEKQGETFTKKDVDDAYIEGMAFAKYELEKQKPAWSEEDEEFLRRAINATKDIYPMTANWLKSLKQRYTWKPSKEQLKFLQHYADQNNYDGTVLTSLLNDLKKL